jgi:predicted acyl esterase
LRGQDWFDGRLATVGGSYLAYVQRALALDPPPELTAMVVQISPHDLSTSCFGHGPFELYSRLVWSDMVAHQEQQGLVRWVWRALRTDKRLGPMLNRLPPTPSLGGRVLSYSRASRDNTALEARDDVLTFSNMPLAGPVHVAGAPTVRLQVSYDGACTDIFARLCDVDERGRSRDLTDQIVRLGPADPPAGEARSVSLALTDISHVFLPGHRIRLQVSGGAFPRYARNLGTAENPVTGAKTAPVSYRVFHGGEQPSAIAMPVLPPGGGTGDSPGTSAAR